METINVTIQATAILVDGYSVDQLVDDVETELRHIGGFHIQTIQTSAMDLSDVVPGSPLAKDMISHGT